MVSQLEPFIDFDLDKIMKEISNTRQYYRSQGEKPRPWSFGELSLFESSLVAHTTAQVKSMIP